MTPATLNAQRTDVLIAAIRMLKNTDFTQYTGSGVLIRLTNLAGELLTAEFYVAGEDMEIIKQPIVRSIKSSLEVRKELLLGEIARIESCLSKQPTNLESPMPRLQFTCPRCRSRKLEEIMVNVTVSSEIATIEVEDGEVIEINYEDQTNEDGEVDRYQCAECGKTICTETLKPDSPGLIRMA